MSFYVRWGLTKADAIRLALASSFMVIAAVIGTAAPLALVKLLHTADSGNGGNWVLLYMAAITLPALVQSFSQRQAACATVGVSARLKMDILRALSAAGLPPSLSRGHLLTLLDHDTMAVESAWRSLACSVAPAVFSVVTVLVVMTTVSFSLVFLFAVYILLLWAVFVGSRRTVRHRQTAVSLELAARRSLLEKLAHHFRLMTQQPALAALSKAIEAQQNQVRQAKMNAFLGSQPAILLPQLLHCVVLVVVLAWLVPSAVARPAEMGVLLAVILYSERIVWPVSALASDWASLTAARVSLDRVQAVAALKSPTLSMPLAKLSNSSLTLVSGPVGSGKTQYVKRHAAGSETGAGPIDRYWNPTAGTVFVDAASIQLYAAAFSLDEHDAAEMIFNMLCGSTVRGRLVRVYLDETLDSFKDPDFTVSQVMRLLDTCYQVFVITHCGRTRSLLGPLATHQLEFE